MNLVLAGSAVEQAPPLGSGGFRRTDAGDGEYFARLYDDRLRAASLAKRAPRARVVVGRKRPPALPEALHG